MPDESAVAAYWQRELTTNAGRARKRGTGSVDLARRRAGRWSNEGKRTRRERREDGRGQDRTGQEPLMQAGAEAQARQAGRQAGSRQQAAREGDGRWRRGALVAGVGERRGPGPFTYFRLHALGPTLTGVRVRRVGRAHELRCETLNGPRLALGPVKLYVQSLQSLQGLRGLRGLQSLRSVTHGPAAEGRFSAGGRARPSPPSQSPNCLPERSTRRLCQNRLALPRPSLRASPAPDGR